jgi:hypothetical protein
MNNSVLVYGAVFIVIVGLFIFLFLLVLRKNAGKKYFAELAQKNDFRTIKPEVEVFRVKALENIVNKDFLVSDSYSLKIKTGVIKYNLQETTLIGNGMIQESASAGEKKSIKYPCSFLLHLDPPRHLEMPARIKIRLKSSKNKQFCLWYDDLSSLFEEDDDLCKIYTISTDKPIRLEDIPGPLKSAVSKLVDKFPFKSDKDKGVLILTSKGWCILGSRAVSRKTYDSFFEIDEIIVNCWLA